uniref:Uncharacterized protein n=1 Tax=Zonotrichia albicollis TaxID=44394 RepID=A0A8D2NNV9_ZONAL
TRRNELQLVPPVPPDSALLAPPVPAVLKKRLVKLVVNFLFYFRTDEAEVGTELLAGVCSPPPVFFLCAWIVWAGKVVQENGAGSTFPLPPAQQGCRRAGERLRMEGQDTGNGSH